MMKKMLSLALAFAAMASLTACGAKAPEATVAETTAKEGTVAGSDAAGGKAAADVQKIIDRGVLKVGCKADIPKFSLQNTATGEYEGFEDDLA